MSGRLSPLAETAAALLLGLLAIHLALAPLSRTGADLPAPDLVFCLACAWTLRRPAAAPLWAVLALGLVADVALDRPLGLGALGLLVATEGLRRRAGALSALPFFAEWAVVAGVAFVWALCAQAALKLVFLDGPGLGPLLAQAAATAIAYPFVVALLAFGLGMRSRRPAPARPGRLP